MSCPLKVQAKNCTTGDTSHTHADECILFSGPLPLRVQVMEVSVPCLESADECSSSCSPLKVCLILDVAGVDLGEITELVRLQSNLAARIGAPVEVTRPVHTRLPCTACLYSPHEFKELFPRYLTTRKDR